MFEKASRLNLKFKASNGVISTDDLWNLKLEDLDKIAKAIRKELKDTEEESFIKTKNISNDKLELQFEIIKYIINYKMNEQLKKEEDLAKKQKREYITKLIEEKKEESLKNKTISELEAELNASM